MTGRLRRSPLSPWAGLFVGAAAWFLHHQAGSNANVYACHVAGGPYVIVVGLACAALAIIGGVVSWRAEPPAETPQSHRFARIVGMAAAAIFTLAIGFQVLGGAIVPDCLR
jgi:hypothetical protein